MFKIEKNIPMPSRLVRRGRPPRFPLHEMEIGDSFAVDGSEKKAISTAATSHGKKHGKQFSCFTLPDGSVRVWRVA